MSLLEVRDLKPHVRTDDGIVRAVDGIIGLNNKARTITSGEAIFNGKNLLAMGNRDLRQVRGDDIAMIFPDPMTSLNPVKSIGHQLQEAVLLHLGAVRHDPFYGEGASRRRRPFADSIRWRWGKVFPAGFGKRPATRTHS